MRNKELALDYVRRARIRLRALEVLHEAESWADVVRESQRIVELALKGLLRAYGVEPPRIHDVSALLLAERDRCRLRCMPVYLNWQQLRVSSVATASWRSMARRTSRRAPSTRAQMPTEHERPRSTSCPPSSLMCRQTPQVVRLIPRTSFGRLLTQGANRARRADTSRHRRSPCRAAGTCPRTMGVASP